MRRAYWSAAILLACIVLGCGDDSTGPSGGSSGSSWWPMQIGDYWVYDEDGAIDTMTVEAVGIDSSFADDLVLVVSTGSTGTEQMYWENNSQVLQRWLPEGPSGWYTYVYLQLPLSTGASWAFSEGINAECVSLDAAVTVPAGTFTGCAKIRYTSGDDELFYYFAPQVGLVKGEYPDEPSESFVLTDYAVGG
ncbi:MAG: hypothetical protein R6U36_04070 [Candidatus Fermentibacteraceae bacterium]